MGLDDATQNIAEQLDRPVLIFDVGLNVIAFSAHEGEVDRGRLATILNRRATPIAVEMITRSRARASIEPVVVPPIEGVDARVVMPLRHSGQLYGYLSFATSKEVSEAELDLYAERLAPASERMGAILALRDLANRDSAGNRQALLEKLFASSSESRTEAAADLIAGGVVAAADSFTVVAIRPRTAGADISRTRLAVAGIIRDLIRSSSFQTIGGVVDSSGIVVIPGLVDAEHVIRTLRKQAGQHPMIAGVGGSRPRLTEVLDSLREARIAAESIVRTQRTDIVAFWEALGVDRLLLQLPLDTLRVTDLPLPVQHILAVQSGIDLARTLEAYLRCGGDAQATARFLHIHRSTLYYRLDKIRETTDLDLSDGLVRRELHTGLRIAQLAGFWAF